VTQCSYLFGRLGDRRSCYRVSLTGVRGEELSLSYGYEGVLVETEEEVCPVVRIRRKE